MIAARQIAFGGSKRKPYDAEIEYLESTGTQYIDLPFGFKRTDEIRAAFSVEISQVLDKYIIAPIIWNVPTNTRFGLGIHNKGVYTMAFGAQATGQTALSPAVANDGEIHNWEYKDSICTITDLAAQLDVSNIVFGSESKNLRLFYGYNSPTKGKVVSYTHVKDGEKILDLIPVRKGNIGYMYDKVSGQLFGNAGTGAFVLGADAVSVNRGGYNRRCIRRSYRRSWRASTRFSPRYLWKEVA